MDASGNGFEGRVGTAAARRRRQAVKVAPVARAVRAALAASATALALAGAGAAFAGERCAAPADAMRCSPAQAMPVHAAVEDLTVVAARADVDIDNTDDVFKVGGGDQIGLYANATDGDAIVHNSAYVGVYSGGGIADGIFAAGDHVSVDNSGDIVAIGSSWGAGIEAQGEDLTTVANTGSLYAYGFYGFGIYATGGDIEVNNDGPIEAQGYIANGIYTRASGDTTISNTGDITAGTLFEYNGSLYGSLQATGIHAGGNYAGTTTTVGNSGDIDVLAYAGATGIEVVATGEGSSGIASNSGTILASQYSKYGSGAAGIVVSADGDAAIDNAGGITAISSGGAYGAMALAFNGDATVTNSGDINAYSVGSAKYYGAYGILAASQNGSAHVDNAGTINVVSDYLDIGYTGMGIRASGLEGATVVNSGSISVDAKYAYGIYASAGAGDVLVDNAEGALVDVYSYFSVGFGVLALTGQGDIEVDNEGTIDVYAYGQAVGVFARPGEGDAFVHNGGDILVESGGGTAAGIFARADYGSIDVANDGNIEAYAGAGAAFGILGSGGYANASNTGTIDATGYAFASGINVYGLHGASVVNEGTIGAYGVVAANGIYAGGGESVEIHNSGDIVAVSYGLATGIYGYSAYGDVSIDNSGYVGALSLYDVADGIFASGGNVDVSNSGDIVALGTTWGAGIEAQGADGTTVSNSGNIYAYGAYGFGIYATGGEGGIGIDNAGAIEAQGYIASGVYAQGSGDIDIVNSGDVTAGTLFEQDGYLYGSLLATGIHAASNGVGAAIGVDNSGVIAATGYQGAIGIEAIATGEGGSASVDSSGAIYASQYSKYGYGAAGIVVSADGDAGIDNSGLLAVESGGLAYGALALSFNGDATVVNAGDIDVHSAGAAKYYGAFGIVAASQNGSALVDNSGSVYVTSDYLDIGYIGMGIQAVGMDGATVTNSGEISVDAKYAYGIYASSGAGDVSVTNAAGGTIDVYSYFGSGFGVLALATQGDVDVGNAGVIDVYAYGQAVGAFTSSTAGNAYVDNGGDLVVDSGGSVAAGAFARAGNGIATIHNTGSIATSAYGTAYGALARGAYAGITNAGDITAASTGGSAIGAYVSGYAGAAIYNDGSIHAEATYGNAIGVFATAYGDVLVENGGTISATHPDVAIAVVMDSLYGTSTLDNSGTITTDASVDGSIAVLGGDGVDRILNSGDIHGALVTGGGDDLVANAGGGTWVVGNFSSYLGTGDDAITNASGGLIHLANGGIFLGAADGANAFDNAGLLQVSGFGLVDMGTEDSVLANDGMISLMDGGANDLFVLGGDLGGSGSLGFDANLASGASDYAYIDGNLVAGSTQAIDLRVDGAPTSLSQSFEVLAVTGDATAANFTGGEVFGFDPSNFLDLDVGVSLAQAGGLNVLTASLEVAGLNDTGVLAASVAPGVHSLAGSSIGTWRQRVGVLPALDDGRVGLGPWVRFYTDDGDLSPSAAGFSAHSDFGFEQENRGREFGFNLPVGGGVSIGLLAGTADGTQVLATGTGSSRIDLDYSGLSGTWLAQDFYVDASMRWMDFEAVLASAGGEQHTSGNGTAFNLEAGYTGWQLGTFDLVPQVQYTRTKLDDIAPVAGSLVDFTADGGISERVRVGLGFSRAFASASGVKWTPYGAISAVNELDGESAYMVDGNPLFSGTGSTDGTHALLEAGVGAQFGGVTVTGGLHWADGGAIDSSMGGQLVMRYTW